MTTLASLTATLQRAWDQILLPLCKLNRIQFDAPWSPRRGQC